MNHHAIRLSERLTAFNDELIALVEQCSEDDWQKKCSEEWGVGVVARHIGAGHYAAVVELTKMIVAGDPLPEFTPEGLVQLANDHARENAQCTQSEVLALLRENGAMLRDYTAGLTDDDLHRKSNLELLGGEITAGQFIEALILHSAGEHVSSIKTALDSN